VEKVLERDQKLSQLDDRADALQVNLFMIQRFIKERKVESAFPISKCYISSTIKDFWSGGLFLSIYHDV
jgi:hypothetical protein